MSESDRLSGPAVTVDVIIEMPAGIVLVERRFPPLGWALPGGFVEAGEFACDAAVREAREETCLEVELSELLGVYSNPERDQRRHTVSVVYIGRGSGEPRGGDDARRAEVFGVGRIPELAFDHATILEDYFRWRDRRERPPLRR